MSEPRLPAELRVSDADRDGAVEHLRRHTQVGRLTMDEFEERTQLAYAARTRGDLDLLARDLPDDLPALPAPTPAPDRLRAVLGDVRQGGRWLVPERLEARATLGDCTIDLRQAVFARGGVTIEATAVLGDVKILVPPNAEVELTGTAFLGSKKLRGAEESTGGGPFVRIRAKAILGDVTVDVATFGEKVRGWAHRGLLDVGHASKVGLPPGEVLEANRRYHDVAAVEYDAKWGVSYSDVGRRQVLGKVEKLLGPSPGPFARSLEVGAGTGYFTLNLLGAGVVRSAVATDLSAGMLATLESNAAELGLDVETRACDAAALPFADGSFDIVLGHAVLHHLVDLEACLREFRRVLRPGGTILFAGEPSRFGDRLAAVPKRAARAVAPAWRRLLGVQPLRGSELAIEHGPAGSGGARNGHAPERHRLAVADDHALEPLVDVHAFAPADLERHARAAGFEGVTVRGEELLANWFGWFNRSLEATGEPDTIPWAWTQYAYRGYLALQALDRVLLEPRLPASLFYNLMLTGRRPSLTAGTPPPG